MNSSIFKIIKFFSIFSIFIVLAILYELNFNDINNPKELKLFKSGNTESLCQLNNETELYCFQKKIGNIFSEATPIMIYHIINTNNEIMNRSTRISGEVESNFYQYTKNWNLILDNLNSFYLQTDRLHFFQVTILPIIKYSLQRDLTSSQNKVMRYKNETNETLSTQTKKEINKFLTYKISLTRAKNE
ncbi:hypothetical protein [Halobacteriovorax sp. JY17]|uniref:hypothetical protein n=1 Tax=Halobacteriovorax sp. JY17 TaxID=2014617 RepID=UPI000C6643CE|nr:hypothetical protein [Halobacteriovorax sp. JY17]PIK14819.1 MAG: hypothetical protein CES88_10815 [Halobacteriovorax sp. JY17]